MSKPYVLDDRPELSEESSEHVVAPAIFIEEYTMSYLAANPQKYDYIADILTRRFTEDDLEKIMVFLDQARDDLQASIEKSNGITKNKLETKMTALNNLIGCIELELQEDLY